MAEVTASASAVVQIQQSADGIRPKMLKRFNKPLKRFSTPLAIHPSLAENIEHFSAIHPSDCLSPATGYRHNSTGALTYVGTEGNVWCSSSYYAGNHNAGYLFFRAGDVRPLNGTNRAYGFAVRCVQHLQGYFPQKALPAARKSDRKHPKIMCYEKSYFSFGPAATRLLPSSLPVNFTKFFTKRLARSSALVSHSAGFA